MATMQNVVLTDRTPVTPVARTFVPRGVDSSVGLLVNGAGVPAGESRLSVSMKKVSSKHRGKLTLAIPVVQTEVISGISRPVVVRTAYAELTVTFDDTSSTQERTDLLGMLADSLGTSKTLVHKSFVDLESVYG